MHRLLICNRFRLTSSNKFEVLIKAFPGALNISDANAMRPTYLAAMQDDVKALRVVTKADRGTLLPFDSDVEIVTHVAVHHINIYL